MDTTSEIELNYLTLNVLVEKVVAFAAENQYQQPKPQPAQLRHFPGQMQLLFIFNERWQLLPDSTGTEQLEQVSALYCETQSTLYDLVLCCPSPADAKNWFDYQQQYNARVQQMDSLHQLIQWHQQFYTQLQTAFPTLPIPFPDGYGAAITSSLATEMKPGPLAGSAGPDDNPLPELQL